MGTVSGCFCCNSAVPEDYDFCPHCGCDLRPVECPPELETPNRYYVYWAISIISVLIALSLPLVSEFIFVSNGFLLPFIVCSICFGVSAHRIKQRISAETDAFVEKERERRRMAANDIGYSITAKYSSAKIDETTLPGILQRFYSLDVETTGLSSSSDRIIEIGVVLFEQGVPTKTFSSLVNIQRTLPPRIVGLTGITDSMISHAPTENDVYPSLVDFLGDAVDGKTVICAHNAPFDAQFLCNTFSRKSITANFVFADTLQLSRHYIKGLDNYKLITLASHLDIANDNNHRALSDAESCGKIFCKLLDHSKAEIEVQIAQSIEHHPSHEELIVCAYIQNMLTESGADTTYLRFHRFSNGRVNVFAFYGCFEFKWGKRLRYVLVDKKVAESSNIITLPCSSSEDSSCVRYHLHSVYDLENIKQYICDSFSAALQEIEEHNQFAETYGHTKPYTAESILYQIRHQRALSDDEVAELLEELKQSNHPVENDATSKDVPIDSSVPSDSDPVDSAPAGEPQISHPRKNAKAIFQLDDDGNTLREFESISAASCNLGINPKCIRDALRGVQKHAGGYKWKYKDDPN